MVVDPFQPEADDLLEGRGVLSAKVSRAWYQIQIRTWRHVMPILACDDAREAPRAPRLVEMESQCMWILRFAPGGEGSEVITVHFGEGSTTNNPGKRGIRSIGVLQCDKLSRDAIRVNLDSDQGSGKMPLDSP